MRRGTAPRHRSPEAPRAADPRVRSLRRRRRCGGGAAAGDPDRTRGRGLSRAHARRDRAAVRRRRRARRSRDRAPGDHERGGAQAAIARRSRGSSSAGAPPAPATASTTIASPPTCRSTRHCVTTCGGGPGAITDDRLARPGRARRPRPDRAVRSSSISCARTAPSGSCFRRLRFVAPVPDVGGQAPAAVRPPAPADPHRDRRRRRARDGAAGARDGGPGAGLEQPPGARGGRRHQPGHADRRRTAARRRSSLAKPLAASGAGGGGAVGPDRDRIAGRRSDTGGRVARGRTAGASRDRRALDVHGPARSTESTVAQLPPSVGAAAGAGRAPPSVRVRSRASGH